jgi:hypothetical protein
VLVLKGDLSHFNFVCRLTRAMAKDEHYSVITCSVLAPFSLSRSHLCWEGVSKWKEMVLGACEVDGSTTSDQWLLARRKG